MKTHDWVIIAIGVLAAWYFSQGTAAAPAPLTVNVQGGGSGSGASAGSSPQPSSRPGPGQILPRATALDGPPHPRDIVVNAPPTPQPTLTAMHSPSLGQTGWDVKANRQVFFNGGNWDYGTYSGKFDPNAPDATADNSYIRSAAGTTWYGKDESLAPWP